MFKKIAIVIVLLALAVYFIAAITIWNKPKEGLVCNAVEVIIEDSLKSGFLRENDIEAILKKDKCHPSGVVMEKINLQQIISSIKKNPYIQDVTCYKTPKGTVCIKLKQKCPVLHIMSGNGQDYYIDKNGSRMVKSDYNANLVVATGNITPEYAQKNLTQLALYIQNNDFWNNQIQQINVLDNGDIEIIPAVGEHTILFGKPVNIEDKFERMKKFYTEGLNKVGWNKYALINLKYDNQIVCKKNRE